MRAHVEGGEGAKHGNGHRGIVFYHGNERSLPHLQIMAELAFDTINVGEDIDIEDAYGFAGYRTKPEPNPGVSRGGNWCTPPRG